MPKYVIFLVPYGCRPRHKQDKFKYNISFEKAKVEVCHKNTIILSCLTASHVIWNGLFKS